MLRVLEWADGYYNGDIKTRKTVQAMELKADKMGLQRSEQLRELYECLLEGETDQQATIPTTALSPDDLTDAEWYYLVCMSFVFNPGQGYELSSIDLNILLERIGSRILTFGSAETYVAPS